MEKSRTLKTLLDKLEYEPVQGTLEREITAVVYDSRKVIPGCLFICINGANFDGHDFAAQAAAQGAGVLVVQKSLSYRLRNQSDDSKSSDPASCRLL